jgi:hypothetical protein
MQLFVMLCAVLRFGLVRAEFVLAPSLRDRLQLSAAAGNGTASAWLGVAAAHGLWDLPKASSGFWNASATGQGYPCWRSLGREWAETRDADAAYLLALRAFQLGDLDGGMAFLLTALKDTEPEKLGRDKLRAFGCLEAQRLVQTLFFMVTIPMDAVCPRPGECELTEWAVSQLASSQPWTPRSDCATLEQLGAVAYTEARCRQREADYGQDQDQAYACRAAWTADLLKALKAEAQPA